MSSLKQRFPRYSKLIRFYPLPYRHEYSEQMLQTLADMLDDPELRRSTVWARTVLDFPLSVANQQFNYLGEAMASTTPAYIKRNALLGACLLAPFFFFIILNSLMHQRLHNSWAWHTNVLLAWLILLPSLAVLFNFATMLRWAQTRRKENKISAWKALGDVRHNWPAFGVILVGLAILALVLGHDSVHCVSGNPFRELHNPYQTWQCIQRGNS